MENREGAMNPSSLEILTSLIYAGRTQNIQTVGRRRVRAHTNTGPGLLNDIAGSFGLPADFSNPKFDYLVSLTTAQLTNLCRFRKVRPREMD
jgi:hypothetical protein